MNPNVKRTLRRWFALLAVLTLLPALAVAPAAAQSEEPPKLTDPTSPTYEPPMRVSDPFEGFNKAIYKFNYGFDKYFFLPVVRGYEFITPAPVRKGVTNFFSNLYEVRNFANNLLQGKAEGCVNTLFRFAVNTTLGLGGLLDPATEMGFPQWKEDFGQTLGVWGAGAGPYLVLPIFGPSSLRDAGGLLVDTVGESMWVDFLISQPEWGDTTETAVKWSLTALRSIDTRSNVKFRYYETGSPFEYELLRFIYLKARELQIEQ
jgi:phospholipid-binding lipoprotein MlaA